MGMFDHSSEYYDAVYGTFEEYNRKPIEARWYCPVCHFGAGDNMKCPNCGVELKQEEK